MNSLYKTKMYATIVLVAVILPVTLGLGGCVKNETTADVAKVNLQGTVFSERYMPASGGLSYINSRYSFSINTDWGRQAVQVEDFVPSPYQESKIFRKESIDSLIEKGTCVEIRDVPETDLGRQVIFAAADKITVLGECE